jgi:hypothetical protein
MICMTAFYILAKIKKLECLLDVVEELVAY